MLGVINIVNSTQANALTLYYIYSITGICIDHYCISLDMRLRSVLRNFVPTVSDIDNWLAVSNTSRALLGLVCKHGERITLELNRYPSIVP